jgi:hypothetical protein
MDLIYIRRCGRSLAAVETSVIEEARQGWRAVQLRKLEQLKVEVARDAVAAVAGLKHFALGCRWLIECWEALGGLLESARSSEFVRQKGLSLLSDPHQQHVLGYFAVSGSMGPGIDPLSPDAPPEGSLERLGAIMEWELPRLRILYERLESEANGPVEEKLIATALRCDKKRNHVLNRLRFHTKQFLRSYQFLLDHHHGPPPSNLPGLPPAARSLKPGTRKR